jgi:hypothetical protein
MTTLVKPLTFILGAVLLVVGIAGFVSALVPGGMLLGLFEVNTIHNVIHILSGVVALWAASSGHAYARMYLIVFGLVYGLVAILGFAMDGNVLGLFHANMYDNYLHTAIAVACLAVGFGSKK